MEEFRFLDAIFCYLDTIKINQENLSHVACLTSLCPSIVGHFPMTGKFRHSLRETESLYLFPFHCVTTAIILANLQKMS